MFVETEKRTQGEPQKVGTLKLSEAIRIGKPMVVEGMTSHRFCALGCAWAGYNGRAMTMQDLCDLRVRDGKWSARLGESLEIPASLAEDISSKHCSGVSALEIADWLQEQGY